VVTLSSAHRALLLMIAGTLPFYPFKLLNYESVYDKSASVHDQHFWGCYGPMTKTNGSSYASRESNRCQVAMPSSAHPPSCQFLCYQCSAVLARSIVGHCEGEFMTKEASTSRGRQASVINQCVMHYGTTAPVSSGDDASQCPYAGHVARIVLSMLCSSGDPSL